MSVKSASDIGAKFEADCVVEFKKMLRKFEFYFDRIYDTKSAKSFIPTRPGDFYIGHVGNASVLECKASAVHETLRSGFSSLVTDEQIAEMRLWERSGNLGFYIFRSELSRTIEVWDARQIFQARLESKPLPAEGWLKQDKYENLYDILYWTFLGQYQ